MMTRSILMWCLLLWCNFANAEIAVDGPNEVSIGGRCILIANGAEDAAALKWELEGGGDQIIVFDDGLRVAFFTGPKPGTHTFLLIAAVINGDDVVIETVRHTVTVTGSGGAEPPVTPPVDPIPDGEYGLTRLAHDLAQSVPKEHRDAARLLATVYRTNGSGDVKSIDVLISATRNSTRSILQDDEIQAWTPAVLALAKALDQLVENGKLQVTVKSYKAAWLAIADGLELVKP